MSEQRLIKKYANRRLYDASQSRHITLDDIRTLVVAGVRVKVIEDKTNEDITRAILLQVIADQEQFGAPILSTPLLVQVTRQCARDIGEPASLRERRDLGGDEADPHRAAIRYPLLSAAGS